MTSSAPENIPQPDDEQPADTAQVTPYRPPVDHPASQSSSTASEAADVGDVKDPQIPTPRSDPEAEDLDHESPMTSGDGAAEGETDGDPPLAGHGAPNDDSEKGSPFKADPLAAALGNATLLGLGYFFQRRRLAAVSALMVSTTLVVLIVNTDQPAWVWRALLLLWWVAVIVHGWWTARRTRSLVADSAVAETLEPEGPTVRRHRVITAIAAAVVLVIVLGFAVEGRLIETAAASAHRSGDCARATETLGRIGARHRLVDPYVAQRTQASREACDILLSAYREADANPLLAAVVLATYIDHPSALWPEAPTMRIDLLLQAAGAELERSLEGRDTSPLSRAVSILSRVLELDSDRVDDVDRVLGTYVSQLPESNPCDAKAHIEWISGRDLFRRVADQVAAVTPSIFLNCGDDLLDTSPSEAREVYQTVLDRYPDDDDVVSAARAGIDKAETRLEERRLREVLGGQSEKSYCDEPVRYRAAPAYRGRGPHRVVIAEDAFQPDDHIRPEKRSRDNADGILHRSLSSKRLAKDVTDATLVLCASMESAEALAICHYERDHTAFLHRGQLRVRAYEIRTGKLAFELTVGGRYGNCPGVLWYREPLPPPMMLYTPIDEKQVRNALRPKISP